MAEPDIAVLTFDAADKGANVLSRPVLEELERRLDELEKQKDLEGLILDSAKPGIFIFGADIREFLAAKTITARAKGRAVDARPQAVSAAVAFPVRHGGRDRRRLLRRRGRIVDVVRSADHVDSPKAQMGFPEVKLGIYPGWGGTARAPRMIGLSNAVEMVTGGENVDARTAFTMGLVSDVVPSDKLRQAAINLIRAENKSQQYLQDRKRWDGPMPIDETELMFLGVTAIGLHPAADQGAVSGPDRGAGSDDRLGRQRHRSGLRGRGRGFCRPVRLADQSVAVEHFLSHGSQQERNRRHESQRQAQADPIGRRFRRRHHGGRHRGRLGSTRHGRDDHRRHAQGPGRRRAEGAGRGLVQQGDPRRRSRRRCSSTPRW